MTEIRVGDEERQAALVRLGTAVAEGRLTAAEFEERSTAAASARTTTDLEPLTADLPTAKRSRAERHRAEMREEWAWWAGGALVMTVIWVTQWLKDGDMSFYWPVTPLAIWAAVLLATGFRR